MSEKSGEPTDETALTRKPEAGLRRLAANLRTVQSVLARSRDQTSATIGIDFGFNSLTAAVWDQGTSHLVKNLEGSDKTPAFVAFKSDGERLVGARAKRQAFSNLEGTISSVRRFIGRTYENVGDVAEEVSFEVTASEDGLARVKVSDRKYSFTEILGSLLHKVKNDAANHLDKEVEGAVLAVPPYFADTQKSRSKDAGRIGGLPIKHVTSRPISAVAAYNWEDPKLGKTVLCYDLSRNCFCVSVVQQRNEGREILAYRETSNIGGNSLDECLANHIAEGFEHDMGGINLRDDEMAWQRIQEVAREAKIELTDAESTTVNLPFISATDGGPLHLNVEISRSEFEKLIAPTVRQMEDLTKRAVKEAGMSPREIDEVILVGVDTRIPYVRQRVADIMGQEPLSAINPEQAVAFGAAVQGGRIEGLI